ncbi:MAG: patatin-like phospholipase family protein [Candidatus Bipolaricaulia bacterium]
MNVGLVLGGGGARGYAHIGVAQVLQQHRIPIDIVVGTSMGAAIGGALVCGIDLDMLGKVLKTLDLNELLGIPTSIFREIEDLLSRTTAEYFRKEARWRSVRFGSSRLSKLFEFYSLFTKNQGFEDLTSDFAVVAVDIDTGKEVIIETGKLYRAIAASSAIPEFFYPVWCGGHCLVDGGSVNNLPIDVAVDRGADVVIAVDVSAAIASKVKTSFDVLIQAQLITSRELTRVKTELAKQSLGERLWILHPDVQQASWSSLREIAPIIEAGRREAERHIAAIQEMIATHSRRLSADA